MITSSLNHSAISSYLAPINLTCSLSYGFIYLDGSYKVDMYADHTIKAYFSETQELSVTKTIDGTTTKASGRFEIGSSKTIAGWLQAVGLSTSGRFVSGRSNTGNYTSLDDTMVFTSAIHFLETTFTEQGKAYIYTGTGPENGWAPAIPYIWNGSKWIEAEPYIRDGGEWK